MIRWDLVLNCARIAAVCNTDLLIYHWVDLSISKFDSYMK